MCKSSKQFLDHDLIHIWSIRHHDMKRFTWRQRNPFIQRRLDHWLISDLWQEDKEDTDIPSINPDCSAISLLFKSAFFS